MGFFNAWDEKQKGFGITVAISLFLHLFVFLAILLFFSSGSSFQAFKPPIYAVELFDTIQQKAPLPVVSPAAKGIEDEKTIVLKKQKLKEKEEAALAETIQKMKKGVREKEIEQGIAKAREGLVKKKVEQFKADVQKREKTQKAVVAAPVIKGEVATESASREIAASYIQSISNKIQSSWAYAGAGTGLEATIIIKIDRAGNLLEKRFERKSGNSIFDQSVLKAIDRASPLPSFPAEIPDKTLEIGIRFCPHCE